MPTTNFDIPGAPAAYTAYTDTPGDSRQLPAGGGFDLVATGTRLTVWLSGTTATAWTVDGVPKVFPPFIVSPGVYIETALFSGLTDAPHRVTFAAAAGVKVQWSPAYTVTGAAPAVSAPPFLPAWAARPSPALGTGVY